MLVTSSGVQFVCIHWHSSPPPAPHCEPVLLEEVTPAASYKACPDLPLLALTDVMEADGES